MLEVERDSWLWLGAEGLLWWWWWCGGGGHKPAAEDLFRPKSAFLA